MANRKHLNILREGVHVWNRWRLEEGSDPNLNRADLSGMNLTGANFYRVQLAEANLSSADLVGADFDHASLCRARLHGANCAKADFLQAHLAEADFSSCDLSSADMTETDLSEINFSWANLTDVNFDNAFLWGAMFIGNNLSSARHLHTIRHQGPSTIDVQTIYSSKGQIPDSFLRGVGVPEDLIVHLRTLDWDVSLPSCFISYAKEDHEFADRLYNSLEHFGVRCWIDAEDLIVGDAFPRRIEESIQRADQVIVVVSEPSIFSEWVEREVRLALRKEERSGDNTVLIPIQIEDISLRPDDSWLVDVERTRMIGDFRNWRSSDQYDRVLARFVRDLRLRSLARSKSTSPLVDAKPEGGVHRDDSRPAVRKL